MFEGISATVVTAFATLLGVRIAVSRADRESVSRAEVPQFPAYPVIAAEPPKARRVPHYQRPTLTVISSLPRAADVFIQWMNEEGYVGLYSASEIDTYWNACCEMLDLEPLRPKFLREALDAKGAKVGLTRLNSPQYMHIRQRTGKDRLVLYRIPRFRGAVGSEPAVPGGSPGTPSPARQSSGIVSGNRENDSDFRRVA